MKILFFCPRWGQEALPWNDFLAQVKNAGYDGVECALPEGEIAQEQLRNGLRQHRLRFIAQHWQTVVYDFDEHQQQYEQRLKQQAAAKPQFINSQTGKDYYSFEQNARLIATADRIAHASGIPVVHETHRGKFSFAAHVMQDYLHRLPSLRITLDISHWCAVAETLLHDQQAAVEKAILHTDHLHARIGHTQGPQVIDPRAPEYQEAMDFHLQCWDKVIDLKRNRGDDFFTITPEFGAPPYLPVFPFTQQPMVNQWEINLFMMDLLKKRYP
ncbi:MAG: sugar phosphate isomerase/epimerase [Chitinophagaceae bacterium]